MELIDTIDGMISADYKERFKAEYWQLKIRYDNLMFMLEKYCRGELDFKPKTKDLLIEQCKAMRLYITILKLRANDEGINLD